MCGFPKVRYGRYEAGRLRYLRAVKQLVAGTAGIGVMYPVMENRDSWHAALGICEPCTRLHF